MKPSPHPRFPHGGSYSQKASTLLLITYSSHDNPSLSPASVLHVMKFATKGNCAISPSPTLPFTASGESAAQRIGSKMLFLAMRSRIVRETFIPCYLMRRKGKNERKGSKRESERDVNQLSPPLQAAHSKGKLAQ